MPVLREQSAPTDALTPSGLIARRWSVEMREGRRPRERLVPERSIHGQETAVLPTGAFAGLPEDALDCAAGLYLGDPTL